VVEDTRAVLEDAEAEPPEVDVPDPAAPEDEALDALELTLDGPEAPEELPFGADAAPEPQPSAGISAAVTIAVVFIASSSRLPRSERNRSTAACPSSQKTAAVHADTLRGPMRSCHIRAGARAERGIVKHAGAGSEGPSAAASYPRLDMGRRTRGVLHFGVMALLVPRFAGAADTAPPPPPEVATGVRLADAVNLALTRNERARISDLNVAVAEANVERARAGFLPVITATATGQQHAYAPTDRTPNNMENAGITVNQPILSASTYPLYAQAKNLASAQRAQTTDDKRLLAFAAANAFFAVLDASALLQAAQNQLETAKANLADAQARADAGLTSSNDVTRARIDMASSSRQVEIGQGNVETSVIDLELVVNARLAAPFTPPGDTLSAAERAAGDVESLVTFAVAHRPDVAVSKFDALAAHDFAEEPLLRIVPTLSLQGQATATSNSATGRWARRMAASHPQLDVVRCRRALRGPARA
jgi:hypothetical protein